MLHHSKASTPPIDGHDAVDHQMDFDQRLRILLSVPLAVT